MPGVKYFLLEAPCVSLCFTIKHLCPETLTSQRSWKIKCFSGKRDFQLGEKKKKGVRRRGAAPKSCPASPCLLLTLLSEDSLGLVNRLVVDVRC